MKAIKMDGSTPVLETIIYNEAPTRYRLNKYISDSGYASRRGADKLIEKGQVTLDGKKAVLGDIVEAGMVVKVNGTLITHTVQKVYIALNKPVGITSTTDIHTEGNLTEFMDYDGMIFPIGRLDKESTGLLLMTNDGDIVNKILREEYGHDKSYDVRVESKITPSFIESLRQGVEIYNPVTEQMQMTLPCDVTQTGPYSYTMILKQGLNRQIRRMASALHNRVVSLNRTRVLNIELEDLPVGHWRYLRADELKTLNAAIEEAIKHASVTEA